MAVHLAYEKGELKGMTTPLQEMLLHQVSLVVANLVALSQRVTQLEQMQLISLAPHLNVIRQDTLAFLKQERTLTAVDLQGLRHCLIVINCMWWVILRKPNSIVSMWEIRPQCS